MKKQCNIVTGQHNPPYTPSNQVFFHCSWSRVICNSRNLKSKHSTFAFWTRFSHLFVALSACRANNSSLTVASFWKHLGVVLETGWLPYKGGKNPKLTRLKSGTFFYGPRLDVSWRRNFLPALRSDVKRPIWDHTLSQSASSTWILMQKYAKCLWWKFRKINS